jgi:hypothetical protein
MVNEYRDSMGMEPYNFGDRPVTNGVVQSVMRRLEETEDMICEPCRQAGRGAVAAHYPAQDGQPAMCWYCKNGKPSPLDKRAKITESEDKPMSITEPREPVREPVMENTKAGRIPKGVCATPGCMNHRHALDCTGYCQECKRLRNTGGKHDNVQKAMPAPVPSTNVAPVQGGLRIESSMVDRLWALIDSGAQAKALNALWPSLSDVVRMDFLKTAVEQMEAQPQKPVEARA